MKTSAITTWPHQPEGTDALLYKGQKHQESFFSSDESFRLSALRDLNICPSRNDERFNRIVRIAAAHFQMPICKISIIDHEKNWYKASIGTEEEECARATSICQYAIHSNKPLIVPDLSQDMRFSGLPQVVGGKKFRFYAGAPIILDNGARVGSLCLMDTVPHRHISHDDIQFLEDLSDIVSRELMQQRNSAQRVQEMIDYDPLTKLYSRMFIQTKLQLAIIQARKTNNQIAAICIDIDDFTHINDSRGHFFGDKFIQAIGERLAHMATPTLVPGRLSGDKFLMIVTEFTSQETLDNIVEVIFSELAQPLEIDEELFHPSCCLGVAIGPPKDGNAVTLQKYADWALHEAKANGKQTIRFFTKELYTKAVNRLQLAIDLKSANLDQEFELYYQPFMDLRSNKIIGYEALLRWHHPKRGLIAPCEFIPIAEETRMIGKIGEWVLRQACEDASHWESEQFVSINLSPSQFRNQNIVTLIKSALEDSGLAPERLEVEITENALISNFDMVNCKLQEISELGVSIALDDFGTGYSSLSYLAALNFDKLKIDKFFIDRINEDTKIRKIITMITRLARSIDTVIVAEGVEQQCQHDLIKSVGCQVGQGYFYGRPAPAHKRQTN